MPTLKLTDPFIRHVEEPDKRIEFYDSYTSGLAVRVTPSGSKSFVYRYRFKKKVRRFTIGKYPKISLVDARKTAGDLAYQISQGIDPLEEKKKRKYQPDAKNFRQLVEKYKERHLPSLRRSTRQEYKRIIEIELLPELGEMPVSSITSHVLRKIFEEKAIENGSPTMANRIRSVVSSIFNFAIKTIGLKLDNNPVESTSPYKAGENKRDRVYNEDEIRILWDYLEFLDEPIGSIIRMLLITGQRKTETCRMKWEDIEEVSKDDFNGMVWTIPARDAKNKRKHEVPLSKLALEVVTDLKPLTGESKYVFESPRKDNQAVGWLKSSVLKIKKDTRIKDFRLHDLRRTAATYMAEQGVNPMIIGKVLNHKGLAQENTITARYNRATYLKQKQEALNRWDSSLRRILEGKLGARIYSLYKE